MPDFCKCLWHVYKNVSCKIDAKQRSVAMLVIINIRQLLHSTTSLIQPSMYNDITVKVALVNQKNAFVLFIDSELDFLILNHANLDHNGWDITIKKPASLVLCKINKFIFLFYLHALVKLLE